MLSQNEKKSNRQGSSARISNAEISKISALTSRDFTVGEIAHKLGLSETTVCVAVRAEKLVKACNWAEAITAVEKGDALKYYEYFASVYGVELPDDVKAAAERYRERLRNYYHSKQQGKTLDEEPEQIDIDLAPQAAVEKKNEDLYLCKVLEALAKQNELLEQLMDVVLPKCIGDLKDNINANTDLLTERIKNCEGRLEKIAVNTRKRGA